MTRIRRFGVVKTATVAAVFYAVASLIFFTIFAAFVLIAGTSFTSVPGNQIPGGMFGATAGAMGVLIFGVILAGVYGVFGWILTALACLLYNVVAGFTGGIEFQLELAPPPAPVTTWTPASASTPAAPAPAAPAPAAPPPAEAPAAPPTTPPEPPTDAG